MTRLYNGIILPDRPCPVNVRRLDMGVVPMVVEMHQQGVLIDQEHFRKLQRTLTTKLSEVEVQLHRATNHWRPPGTPPGTVFNPGSHVQCGQLLYKDLKIHASRPGAVKTTSSGALSTADENLSLFRGVHPAVELVLEWREYSKLLTTYAYKIPRMALEQGGRIHTEFLMTRTATGRFASKNINLQNIPTRGEWGREIRNGFIAKPGWVLGSLDLSQIEMVVVAHMSQDPMMMQVFQDGLDVHNKTACAIFQLDESRIEELAAKDRAGTLAPGEAKDWKVFKQTQRLPCKTLGFGILYGQTAEGLQTQIAAAGGPWWELDKCERLINDWFEVYHGIYEWMQMQYQRARRYGMVWDLFGRTRKMAGVRSVHNAIVNKALRECGNMPIQATAGGVLKLAMAMIMQEIVPLYREDVGCLLTIHDELVFEIRKEVAEEFLEVGRAVMESVVPLSVPVRSSMDMAERWGDMK